MQCSLIGDYPNTYTFTKALAEQIIQIEGAGLPIAIVRPSIVSAAYKEPSPGWIDVLNGPTGLILIIVTKCYNNFKHITSFVGLIASGGKGFIRIFKRKNENYVTDLIPVDIPINLMIALAWDVAINK